MKKFVKDYIAIIQLVIVFTMVASLSLTSCKDDSDDSKTISGTVTADAEGNILFMYSRASTSYPDYCTFTTDLPSPDNQFTITITTGESTGRKEIDGLEAGQKVAWTATVKGKPLNHGSGSFVHIINSSDTVYQ